jgi:hypothetical protein
MGCPFPPFATLMYLLLYTPGRKLSGGHWAAGASRWNQIPGRCPSEA